MKISKHLTDMSTYMDADNFVYIAASAHNVGTDYSANNDHKLISHYVEIANPFAGTKSVGYAVDVYMFAPDFINEEFLVKTVTNGSVTINESYILDIVEIREALSGVVIPREYYDIFNNSLGETYGDSNDFIISLPAVYAGINLTGAALSIQVRRWVAPSYITDALMSDTVRYPATSLKVKAYPLTVVSIDYLLYRNGPTVDAAKEAIKELILSSEGTLELSDFIGELYRLGATFVDTSMTINIKAYDHRFSATETALTSTYSVPSDQISQLYTNIDLLGGVIRG